MLLLCNLFQSWWETYSLYTKDIAWTEKELLQTGIWNSCLSKYRISVVYEVLTYKWCFLNKTEATFLDFF